MKLAHRFIFIGALAALVFPCVVSSADTPGKVLFVSNRDGNAQIYVMNVDGTGQRALTKGPEENAEPTWSPDGTRITFTSYRDGNAEIYVMDANGDNQTRLTSDRLSDNSPTWTPDGRIVFRSNRGRWTDFYVMNADGTGLKQLTSTQIDKGAPVISPDGKWIAFVALGAHGSSEIHVMPAAGGEAKDVTSSLSKKQKLSPSWSPDSKHLAFVEAKDLALNIRVVDPDGSNPRKITDNVYTNAFPTWSPDGTRFAFVSSREGTRTEMARGDIYVMNADGGDAVNLTRNADEDNYPAWSADGRSVYFVSLRDGTAQIYTVSAKGGEQRRLTNNTGHDLMIQPQALRAKNAQPDKVNIIAAPLSRN